MTDRPLIRPDGVQRSTGQADLHVVPQNAAKSGGESGSLRVATEKVDALINLVAS